MVDSKKKTPVAFYPTFCEILEDQEMNKIRKIWNVVSTFFVVLIAGIFYVLLTNAG